jgi:hypothetical protein
VGTVPGTGRRPQLTAAFAYRVEDGEIAEGWAAIDWLSAVQQLGGTCTVLAGG